MTSRTLLMFHLGPVQPFIEQARKSRDLWMGSYLLSWLMRQGLEGYSGELLFPTFPIADPTAQPNASADTPNKFVALHDSRDEAQAAAKHVERAIKDKWVWLATKVWDEEWTSSPAVRSDVAMRAIWDRQTNPDSLFEIVWVTTPYDTHRAAYTRALELLAARKRLRAFDQPHRGTFGQSDYVVGEPGEKSTISGAREVLHPAIKGKHNERGEVHTFWKAVAKDSGERNISANERLDAIDVIKRLASRVLLEEHTTFPSADTIAVAPFMQAVKSVLKQEDEASTLSAAAREWYTCAIGIYPMPYARPSVHIQNGTPIRNQDLATLLSQCDGEALFVESFTKRQLDDEPRAANHPEAIAEGPRAIRALRRVAHDLGIAPPTPYYAIIKLDGDHMGELVGSLQKAEEHKHFSAALSKFARGLNDWVGADEFLGRVVYAGGDDALILAPADRALQLAHELQRKYGEAVAPTLQVAGVTQKPTASAGIVIAHRLMPLRVVLDEARKAETAAKRDYQRNALVVALLWRSGRVLSVGAKWEFPSGEDGADLPTIAVTALIAEITQRLRDGTLSDRFAHALLREAAALGKREFLTQALVSEVTRLLRRQSNEGHDRKAGSGVTAYTPAPKEESGTDIGQLAKQIVALARGITPDATQAASVDPVYALAHPGPRAGMVEACGWLQVASFLARGGERGDD